MKKHALLMLVIFFTFILLCLFILIFRPDLAYKFVTTNEDKTQCYAMPIYEAKLMVNRILDEKAHHSSSGLILYGFKREDIVFSKYKITAGFKGDGDSSIDIEYSNKITKKPLFKAIVYETCEVQWVQKTSKSEVNDISFD